MTTREKISWRIGELARQTGLSVRTLRYYEQLGLLTPSGRTEAGYRLYNEADVQRLQQILSLRQIGFSLAQIGDCLRERCFHPAGIVRLHIERLRQEIELRRETVNRLLHLTSCLAAQQEVSGEEFIRVLEVMTTMENNMEKYYSPEQLKYLKKRYETLGEDRIREVEKEWPDLIARVKEEMAKGTPPTDEKVRILAGRWRELVEMFTGGDEGVARSLSAMYHENPDVAAAHGPDDKIRAYISRALHGE